MHDAELRSHELSRYTDAIRDASRPCLIGNISETVGETTLAACHLYLPISNGLQKTVTHFPLLGNFTALMSISYPVTTAIFCSSTIIATGATNRAISGNAIVVHLSGNSSRVLPELPTLQVPAFFGLRKKTVQPKVYKRVNISLSPSTSYPSYERKLIAFDDDVAEECYLEFCGTIQPDIQIGGYPSPVQSDSMELDCVNAFGLGTPEQWVLLLQVFEIGDMMWGDAGALYWFIHQTI